MKSEIKTALVFGVVIAAAIGGLSIVFSSLDEQPGSTTGNLINIDKSGLKKAPKLVGISHHLNIAPEELTEKIKDSVVLYDIWTYSCINCIRTLPYITAWNDKYADDGLLIIGIHSPEFEFEKDLANVEMAVDKHGIIYPVVMDNEWETWEAFENRYWPRKYIADHEGYIRYDHIGEGAYKETEDVIQALLAERATSLGLQIASAKPLVEIEEFDHSSFRTPELYFGYKFAFGRNNLGSSEGFSPGNVVTYSEPDELQLHKFYPVGTWRNTTDSMLLESDTGAVKLLYNAKQVNIVASGSAKIELFLDGQPLPVQYHGTDLTESNVLSVDEPGLYNIIDRDVSSSHMLELKIDGNGLEMFTFTFG